MSDTNESLLKRIDSAWAKGEGRLLVGVLILMILVAGFQAAVRNLTRFDVQWANELLTDLDWADSLLRKGTLWLSFLGASLATYNMKHINMDILLRVAPPKPKYTMLAVASLIGAIICVGMTYSFSSAVYLNLTERPVEYEMLSESGESQHVCDGSAEAIAKLDGLERPTMFCMMRTALGAIGIPAETPGAAFQLIVPLMLFVISLRMFGQSIMYAKTVAGGEEALAKAEEEENQRMLDQQKSLHAEDI